MKKFFISLSAVGAIVALSSFMFNSDEQIMPTNLHIYNNDTQGNDLKFFIITHNYKWTPTPATLSKEHTLQAGTTVVYSDYQHNGVPIHLYGVGNATVFGDPTFPNGNAILTNIQQMKEYGRKQKWHFIRFTLLNTSLNGLLGYQRHPSYLPVDPQEESYLHPSDPVWDINPVTGVVSMIKGNKEQISEGGKYANWISIYNGTTSHTNIIVVN